MSEPKWKIHDGMFRKGDVPTQEHRVKSINKKCYKGRMTREQAEAIGRDGRREVVFRRLDKMYMEREEKQKLSPYSKNPPQVRVEEEMQGSAVAKITKGAMQFLFLPPVETNEDLYERTEDYMTYCVVNERKPTITGWCNALGVSNVTLSDWEHERTHKASGRSKFIKRVRSMFEEILQANALDGNINPVLYIFLSKAQYGYKDTHEHVIVNANSSEGMSPDEIRKNIAQSLPSIDVEEVE
jgi:hypothetical protein